MSFILAPKDTIKIVIKVSIPEDNNRTKKADFSAEFKKLSVTDTKELLAELESGELTDGDVIRDHLVDLKGVRTPEGQDIEFSDDLREQLMDIDYARKPLVEAFMSITLGKDIVEGLRRKN